MKEKTDKEDIEKRHSHDHMSLEGMSLEVTDDFRINSLLTSQCQSGFTLCRILKVSKLSVTDFFKEMPQFLLKSGPIISKLYGTDREQRLEARELQANFAHLTVLIQYYKRVFLQFFFTSDPNDAKKSTVAYDNKESDVANNGGPVSKYHRFGWLLFLALQVHAFSRFKDLVACTNG